MLHVELVWSGFAMQGDFGFLDWLAERDACGLYSRTHLEHMRELTFSQPQIRNAVEYHFGVGLQLWIATELKPVLKSSSNSCLSSNITLSWCYPIKNVIKNINIYFDEEGEQFSSWKTVKTSFFWSGHCYLLDLPNGW